MEHLLGYIALTDTTDKSARKEYGNEKEVS